MTSCFARRFVRLPLLPAVLLLAGITGCQQDPGGGCEALSGRGKLVSSLQTAYLDTAFLNQTLDYYQVPLEIPPRYAVTSYKLVYATLDMHGRNTTASAVLFVPEVPDRSELPLLSSHHGTQTYRHGVGSVNPLFALESLLLASSGYVTIAPDYLGLGESPGMHPYLHTASSAAVVVDGIRAARSYCCEQGLDLNDQVFLSGYSEGGYVTLAAQREIETNYSGEISLTAVAPMAGPYDLLGTARDILARTSYAHPAYFGYIFLTYDAVYGWDRLEEVFQSPYAGLLPQLFDGTWSNDAIDGQLTPVIGELFDSTFVDDFLGAGETAVKSALRENSLLGWAPLAPVRFFHGNADQTVPYANAVTARDSLRARGGLSVELITIENGTHLSAAPPAFELALEWFNSFTE